MKTTDIPIPVKRAVCAFCNKSLLDTNGKWKDLNICTTNGTIILACTAHAEHGDAVVTKVQWWCRARTAALGTEAPAPT